MGRRAHRGSVVTAVLETGVVATWLPLTLIAAGARWWWTATKRDKR